MPIRKGLRCFHEQRTQAQSQPLRHTPREFDDWAVLFNCDTGRGFGLNPTGVYLWKLLDGEHSIHEMLDVLHRDLQEVPPEALTHLGAFVEELGRHGLVTYAAGQSFRTTHRGGEQAGCSEPVRGAHVMNGMTLLAYETPQLVDLSGGQAAGCSCTCCNSGGGHSPCCCNGSHTSNASNTNCCLGSSTDGGLGACFSGAVTNGGMCAVGAGT